MFKVYDFNVGFPGSPVVVIEAYDYDAFFGDDLIGTSKLDLDDRFFNKEWCAIENKPIEPSYFWPNIPPKLERVILKCLEKSPADRYESVMQIEKDIAVLR